MAACRTLAEVLAAADADSIGDPPPTQAQVNFAASILTRRQPAELQSASA